MARALRNEELETWNDALTQLKRFDGDDFVEDAYKRIEVSYDFLRNEEIRSIFLLCSQLDPSSIPIEDLLKYAVGLGLFKRHGKLKEASDRLRKHLGELKGYYLLQDGNTEGTVKMHDIIHKFAVFVASRDHHMFTVVDELEEWPAKNELDRLTSFSLRYSHDQLPTVLDTPNLESLLLHGSKDQSKLRIQDTFFSQMEELKLMDLTRMSLSPALPSSFTNLVKLQTLCLCYCEVGNIASIGELPMLQVLSLVGSTVAHLPKEIGKLGRLKLLDISHCSQLKVIASGVLSKLTLLEQLFIRNSYTAWEQKGLKCNDDVEKKPSLEELRELKNLMNIDIHIRNAGMFPKDLVFQKLETFRILIGRFWFNDFKTAKVLRINLDAGVDESDEGVKALMGRAEDIYLRQLKGFTSFCELDCKGFPHLKVLNVEGDVDICYIVRRSSCVVFPKLESFILSKLNKLERICVADHAGVESFKKLSIMKVNGCNRLQDLFSSHMTGLLSCLRELTVNECESMNAIVLRGIGNTSDEDDKGQLDEEIIKIFPQLRVLRLRYLPHLTSFYSDLKSTVYSRFPGKRQEQFASNEILEENKQLATSAPLFDKKITLSKLEELELLWIGVKKIWDDRLAVKSFQNLTSLTVIGCWNLTCLFTPFMVKSFVQLKELEISKCESVEEIVGTRARGEMAGEKLLFPKLQVLRFNDLGKLKRFCHDISVSCPSMKQLWIRNCDELKTFVTNDASAGDFEENPLTLFDEKVVFPNLEELGLLKINQLRMIWGNKLHRSSFPKLKDLIIESCGSLEKVFDVHWSTNERETPTVHDMSSNSNQTLPFRNLCSVSVRHCPTLESIFPPFVAPALQQLEKLKIESCERLREIVSRKETKEEEDRSTGSVFLKVTSLQLKYLPRLERFYQGPNHTSDWPNLKKLIMHDCDKIVVSISSSNRMQNLQRYEYPIYTDAATL